MEDRQSSLQVTGLLTLVMKTTLSVNDFISIAEQNAMQNISVAIKKITNLLLSISIQRAQNNPKLNGLLCKNHWTKSLPVD